MWSQCAREDTQGQGRSEGGGHREEKPHLGVLMAEEDGQLRGAIVSQSRDAEEVRDAVETISIKAWKG